MNREIKFRAVIPERNTTIYFTLQDLFEDKFSIREILIPWLKAGNQPDRYSGLKDENDKEIYEGDIVRVSKYLTGVVEYVDGVWWLRNKVEKIWIVFRKVYKDCEVIGNIYENPELLEKEVMQDEVQAR